MLHCGCERWSEAHHSAVRLAVTPDQCRDTQVSFVMIFGKWQKLFRFRQNRLESSQIRIKLAAIAGYQFWYDRGDTQATRPVVHPTSNHVIGPVAIVPVACC